MLRLLPAVFFSLLLLPALHAQTPVQDTIYLMNGHAIGEKVVDTTLGAVTIINPKKHSQRLNFEWDQLYMVRYANGMKRYYYQQDSMINNIFTRDEMWLYMKGENDARRGFKAKGALITSGVLGFLGGVTGTFWGPVAPYGFMALSGITRVRIRHETVSNPSFVDSDAYLLGYERVARLKRKTKSVLGGTIGLLAGYAFYFAFRSHYPENLNFGSK
jgi:hypothetical protein